jgi:hypothetical protein
MNIKNLLLLFLLLFGTIATAQVRLVESNIELNNEKCLAPTFLLSEAQGPRSAKISWQGVPEHIRSRGFAIRAHTVHRQCEKKKIDKK